jgi:sugar (pentulose or hexulose) kinase
MKIVSFDIGAGSGRTVLSDFDGNRITSREIFRFDNKPYYLDGILFWNFLNIMDNMYSGLRRAAQTAASDIRSCGVDTWGVDFGFIDSYGGLIENPVSYRDNRTDGIANYVNKIIPAEKLFKLTSAKAFDFCTLFQIYYFYYFKKENTKNIKTFLLMPGLINYFLTGEKVVDHSILSATQFYDIHTKSYVTEIMNKLELPIQILPVISESGTSLGKIKKDIAINANFPGFLKNMDIILTCSHDSSSMVTGIPLEENSLNSCYINNGTWSVIGIESKDPIAGSEVFKSDFTNWRTFRENNMFLKAFSSFYYLQECKKIWEMEDGNGMSHDDFYKGLEKPSQTGLVNLKDPYLEKHEKNMPDMIIDYFDLTGQKIEKSRNNIILSLLQSIVLESGLSIEELEKLTKMHFIKIYMVGGGSKNSFFCQWIADCLGREIHTGYPESTVNGNIISQLFALGEIKSLNEGREIIRNSNKEKIYYPDKVSKSFWKGLKEKYLGLKNI